ncbi:MAG: aminopeptidase, partial [Gaiellaceae bacterium]
MAAPDIIERLAELTVAFGANVQPGQIVAVGGEIGQEALARAITTSAYRHGARFVDVQYFDPYVKRSRIACADPDTLDFVPSWYGDRILSLGEEHSARIQIAGSTAPGLLDD